MRGHLLTIILVIKIAKKPRRIEGRNLYIDEGTYMRCLDSNGKSFIFDHADYDLIKSYTWSVNDYRGQVRTCFKGKCLTLHRLIMNASDNQQVDHINRDKLDNRRCNLRFATHQQNQCNKGLMSNNTTGYKGTCYDKRSNRIMAYINCNNARTYLGYFPPTEKGLIEAAKAYNQKAIELFGEYAFLNPV